MYLDKGKLHHRLTVLRRLKVWQLLIITILVGFMAATALRLNNLGMVERRDAVYSADKRGDKAQIKSAISELQNYVSSHMNTDLGSGVYLESSYNRARDVALKRAGNASNPNSAVYQKASIECRSRFVGGVASFRNDYVQCVIERVASLNRAADPLNSLQLPRADLYRYDFVSPLISFDLAGILSLATIFLIGVIIARITLVIAYRLLLKTHVATVK